MTQHAEARRNHTVWDELSRGIFTIASIDNFDMLQSYAVVYCGNQNCSYHGTMLQLVQYDTTITYPSISSSQIIDDTATDHLLLNDNISELQSSSQRHRRSTSPGSSPHSQTKQNRAQMHENYYQKRSHKTNT